MTDPITLQAQLDAVNERANLLESRFRSALLRLGIEPDAIERFLTGDEIESDFLTRADFERLGRISEQTEARDSIAAAERRADDLQAILDDCRDRLDQFRHSNGATPVPRLEPEHVR